MHFGKSHHSGDGAKLAESRTSYDDPAAPPHYPESEDRFPISSRSAGPLTPEQPAYPSLPPLTQAAYLTLNVRFESWRSNVVQVLGPDNATPRYILKIKMRKPHLTIESAADSAIVGTVSFPFLSSHIDITVRESEFELKASGLLKPSYGWSSAAFPGVKFTWNVKLRDNSMDCVDEQGVAVARFLFPHLSLRSAGQFVLCGSNVLSDALVEEVLVTGLAVGVCHGLEGSSTIGAFP